MTLDDVLAAVRAHVGYLRGTSAPDGDDWVPCRDVVAERATLRRIVRGTMEGFRTDDAAVAASLFAQSYAFRVASVVLAADALDLPTPDPAPDVTAVRIDKPRPTAVAYLDPQVRRRDAVELAGALVESHFRPFVYAAHDAFPVGERLLWGNVISSCATVYRAVESSGADAPRVRDRAERFLAAAGDDLAGLGTFTTVCHAGRHGWYWDRTSCCLWFRTAAEQWCDNCSLVDPTERHDRRLRELEAAP